MKKLLLAITVLLALTTQAALADFATGKTAYDRKDWPRAIMLLRPLAEQGDPAAQVLLGNMYVHGYGVKRDPAEAYGLYRRAAIGGNAEAMVVTGAMLQEGIGITADVHQALGWYRRAAESGHPAGAMFYGLYLIRGSNSRDGNNILPNHADAYKWLRLSAKASKDEKSREAATTIADELAKSLDRDIIAKADAEVADFKPLSGDALGPIPAPTTTP